MSEENIINLEEIRNRLQNYKDRTEKNKMFTQEEKEKLNKIIEYLSNEEKINKINKLSNLAYFIFFYYNKEKGEVGCTIDTSKIKINEPIIKYYIEENHIDSCGYFDKDGELNGYGEVSMGGEYYCRGYYEHGKFIGIIKKAEQEQNIQQNQQYQNQLNSMSGAVSNFNDIINKTNSKEMNKSGLQ